MMVIVRTYSAGCHAGELESRDGKEVVLTDARRLWSWRGALSLSELASVGSTRPSECRFSVAVPRITLTEVIEVIEMTAVGVSALAAIPPFKS